MNLGVASRFCDTRAPAPSLVVRRFIAAKPSTVMPVVGTRAARAEAIHRRESVDRGARRHPRLPAHRGSPGRSSLPGRAHPWFHASEARYIGRQRGAGTACSRPIYAASRGFDAMSDYRDFSERVHPWIHAPEARYIGRQRAIARSAAIHRRENMQRCGRRGNPSRFDAQQPSQAIHRREDVNRGDRRGHPRLPPHRGRRGRSTLPRAGSPMVSHPERPIHPATTNPERD
jgi:hypothetical protein